MVPYATLYIYFLVVSMNQFCIQGCSNVSIVQNPRELDVGKTTDIKFTCTVETDCNISTSYVVKSGTIVAWIPRITENITIMETSGGSSDFTATIRKPIRDADLGIYYCKAKVSVNGAFIVYSGCGTHLYSGGPPCGTNTGMVVAILWACVGMMYKEL